MFSSGGGLGRSSICRGGVAGGVSAFSFLTCTGDERVLGVAMETRDDTVLVTAVLALAGWLRECPARENWGLTIVE